jgi:hypothetical protein
VSGGAGGSGLGARDTRRHREPIFRNRGRSLTMGGGLRRRTSVGGRCCGGSSGSAEAAAQADGEVRGASGELVVALATWTGSRREPMLVGRPQQLDADDAGSAWMSGLG